MRTLVVEDDFTSRRLLQRLLAPYGDCDIAVNGKEAIEAFQMAWGKDRPYDLVCLDIMMTEMDGQEVLKQIRKLETERRIRVLEGVKIIMTTVLGDRENILRAFREQCDAYLVKPIDKEELLGQIRSLGLLEEQTDG